MGKRWNPIDREWEWDDSVEPDVLVLPADFKYKVRRAEIHEDDGDDQERPVNPWD